MRGFHLKDQLVAYLANEVSKNNKEQIEAHLQACNQCQKELVLLQNIEKLLNSTEYPSETFADHVMMKIIQSPRKRKLASRMAMYGNLVASFVATILIFNVLLNFAPQFSKYESTVRKYGEIAESNVTQWFKQS